MKIASQTRWAASLLAALTLGPVGLGATSASDDALQALDLRQVKVGGEIGRRIDVTVRNNLLALDAEKVFLAPFAARPRRKATSAWASWSMRPSDLRLTPTRRR